MNLIEKAKQFAYKQHCKPEPQRYGNALYSKHLADAVAVAERYLYYLKEDDRTNVIIACWLHDVIEDTNITPVKLEMLFNHTVADIVYRVSNEMGWTRTEKNFKTYPKIWTHDLAIFVKLCDRIANTRNSKECTDKHAQKMYKTYTGEYLIFRAAIKVRNLYPEMWKELDELNTPNR
jgi:(p)ppGpp synthase/HD superfamily hydrolase